MFKFLIIFFILTGFNVSDASDIPLETFLKYPDITSIQISPDGKHFAATIENDGKKRLAILEVKTNKLIHIAEFPHKKKEIGRYGWLNNKRIYASLNYKVGPLSQPRSSGYLYAVNIDGSKKMQLLPSKRRKNQSSGLPVGYRILSFLHGDDKHILISEPDYSYAVAYKLNVYSASKKRIDKSVSKYASLFADHSGSIRLSYSGDEEGKTNTIHIKNSETSNWEVFKQFDAKSVEMRIAGFTKDNQKVYMELANEEYSRGIYTLDLKSKEINLIMALEGDTDIENFLYDLDLSSPEIIGFKQMEGHVSTHYFNNSHPIAKINRSLSNAFKDEIVDIINTTDDKSKAVVRVWSDKNPGSYFLFDMKNYKMEFMFDTYPWIDRNKMAPMKPITFEARDGLSIRGYLTEPTDEQQKHPLILLVHGGPYGVKDDWGYNREAQIFASRGYSVLQVNYRGSGGRGSNFIYNNYLKMGSEMQDDLTDASLWAVEKGYTDKDIMCIYGASYGGYAALMGVVKEPDLYQCSVGYVGLYDINLWKKADTWRSKSGTNFVHEAWGIGDKTFVQEKSPINHVDKIKAAVMLVHGKDDPRVPVENYYGVIKAFDKIGKKYESLLKPYEGHGFYDFDNNVELYTKMIAFFDKHIGKK